MGYKLAKKVRRSWAHLENGPYRLLLEIALELHDNSTECWLGRDKYVQLLGRDPQTKAEQKAAYDSVKRYIAALVSAGAFEVIVHGHPGQNAKYRLMFPSEMVGAQHAPSDGEWGAVSERMVVGESANGGHSVSEWGAVSAPLKKEEEVKTNQTKNLVSPTATELEGWASGFGKDPWDSNGGSWGSAPTPNSEEKRKCMECHWGFSLDRLAKVQDVGLVCDACRDKNGWIAA